MKVTVNGVASEVNAKGLAVHAIREQLGLTGTKLVCGSGVCGACTIAIDGMPVASCLLPCAGLEERHVTTVEGINHPVQRAFAEHDGLQCGYCTPGFIVEAAVFVDRWRAAHGDTVPSREQIADAMAGHLCRCGAYEGIYAAIAATCEGIYDAATGEPARVEAMEKITGRAKYSTDIRLEGQLEGVIVRSTKAHARVVAVRANGAVLVDLLPEDRTVRYVGQPVAAVAAATLDEARISAENVEIDYSELPAALDHAPDAPPVYDAESRKGAPSVAEGLALPARWNGNVRGPSSAMSWRSRTAERRIKAAHGTLVTGTFTTGVQVHTPFEPHACVAHWDPAGELYLHASTQTVEALAKAAAKRWGLQRGQVHVIAEHVGGGFGAKQGLTVDAIAAAELARASGAPVRVVLSRAEELTDAGNRPGTRTDVTLLADGSGDLAALTMDMRTHGGVAVGSGAASLARLIYGSAPRRLRDYDIVTNHPPGKPFRGPGAPTMHWALEQAVDEMAHRLGTDPVALRRRWDGNPKRQALYRWAEDLPVWRDRPATGSQHGRYRRGVGVSAGNWAYIVSPAAEVELTVSDGVVIARSTTQDIGTGTRSVIAGILGSELGLPPSRIRVEIGSSGPVPGPPSSGSQATTSIAPAVRDAARQLLARGLSDGVRVVGRRRRDRRGYLTPFPVGGIALGRGLSGAVHVAEVEVDTRLGKIRPLRVWGGIGVGHIYSPRLARSQCEGGIVQGIGYALYEQRHVDPLTGRVLTTNLEDYRLPGIGDTPEITIHFHSEGWEHVNGGGIGLGEISTIGVAASIGNAVYNATGWRPYDLPIRPDRLLSGMESL